MATNYTVTAAQLAKLTNYYQVLQRTPEYKQIVSLWKDLDAQYGVTGADAGTANGLAGHTINSSTGAVTASSTDVALQDQLPFFP
jgi:hypothetical protein